MPRTEVRSGQVKEVGRSDLDITTAGQAVIRRIIAGLGLEITSTGADPGTGDVTINMSALDSKFKKVLKFEPDAGEEIRRDETATDDYHGIAPDGTATTAASWAVVRFYKDTVGRVIRVRFRNNVAWDSRTLGW